MNKKVNVKKETEALAKVETIINPNLAARPEGKEGEDFLTAIIGRQWGKKNEAWEVYFKIPKNEDECQARYGCDIQDLVTLGVRNLTTKPQYLDCFEYQTFETGPNKGKPNVSTAVLKSHELLQKLADDYRPGNRDLGKNAITKAKAEAIDRLDSFASIDELKAYLKAKGLAD